jgi:hypothetical protein
VAEIPPITSLLPPQLIVGLFGPTNGGGMAAPTMDICASAQILIVALIVIDVLFEMDLQGY